MRHPIAWIGGLLLQAIAYTGLFRKMGLPLFNAIIPVVAEWRLSKVLFRFRRSFWRPFVTALILFIGGYFINPFRGSGARTARLLIDGGITDPIPVDKVHRGKDDLLVAVNVSGHNYDGIHEREKLAEELQKKKSRALSLIFKILPEDTHPTFNYYTLINRSISIAITHNAHRALRLCPPDILVDLPMKRYGGNDYDKYPQLHRIGAQKMNRAIDSFLAGKSISIRLPF